MRCLKQAVNHPEHEDKRWAGAMHRIPSADLKLEGDGPVVCALFCATDGPRRFSRVVMRAKTGAAPAQMLQELREEVAQVCSHTHMLSEGAATTWMLQPFLLCSGSSEVSRADGKGCVDFQEAAPDGQDGAAASSSLSPGVWIDLNPLSIFTSSFFHLQVALTDGLPTPSLRLLRWGIMDRVMDTDGGWPQA